MVRQLSLTWILGLTLAAAAASAQPPQDVATLRADAESGSTLVGTWSLVSAEVKRADGGPSPSPFQAGTRGLLIYDADRQLSFQIRQPVHAPFASGDRLQGTDAEVRAAFEGYLAYWGTWEVDPEALTVRHHITACSFPNWEGTTQVRSYSLDGNRLTLSSSSVTAAGSPIVATFVWRRAR